MKKHVFLSLLMILCIAAAPLGVYAKTFAASADSTGEAVTDAAAATDNGGDEIRQADVTLTYQPKQQQTPENMPEIGSKAAYVAEPTSGKVLFEKNAHEKMYPASTTKILTALLVLENCRLTDTAEVSQSALSTVPEGYSNAGLQAGERVSIEVLLQALLIPSANEAANVLAEHVAGSVAAFAQMCNQRAAQLGCENLHFTNANGMHDENHYCTAYDLYLVAKECQKYEAFREIVKTEKFSVPPTDLHPQDDRTYENTNELLLKSTGYYYAACTGIKTGHTTPAGECLVASSSRNGMDLISVVLGGNIKENGENERFSDTAKLFDFVYDNYEIKTFVRQYEVHSCIEVKKATKDTALLEVVYAADITCIAPKNLEAGDITRTVYMQEQPEAPIARNQVLGSVVIDIDGLQYTMHLIANSDVEKLPFWLYNTLVAAAMVLLLLAVFVFINRRKQKQQRLAARKRRALKARQRQAQSRDDDDFDDR